MVSGGFRSRHRRGLDQYPGRIADHAGEAGLPGAERWMVEAQQSTAIRGITGVVCYMHGQCGPITEVELVLSCSADRGLVGAVSPWDAVSTRGRADRRASRVPGMVRLEAAERFGRGETNAVVAKELRVSVRSVQRWRRAWAESGSRALESGGPASLPAE